MTSDIPEAAVTVGAGDLVRMVQQPSLDRISRRLQERTDELRAVARETPQAGTFYRWQEQQRKADNQPCPKCGGDRLRPAFDGRPECHAPVSEGGNQ